jgi:hypothetical protein
MCERNSELFNVKADSTLSVCFVSFHIFCWINSGTVEDIYHIMYFISMRFSLILRISSE